MPFAIRVRADYEDLFKDTLNKIPIKSVEEFSHIQEALSCLQSNSSDKIPNALKEKISNISDLLENPRDWVEHEENDAEFFSLLHQEIAAKIDQLAKMNLSEKQAALQEREKFEAERAQNHEIMAQKVPPPPLPADQEELIMSFTVVSQSRENPNASPQIIQIFGSQQSTEPFATQFFNNVILTFHEFGNAG